MNNIPRTSEELVKKAESEASDTLNLLTEKEKAASIAALTMIKVCSQIDKILENQRNMAEDFREIKGTIFNPEVGMYTRLKDLETWRSSYLKQFEKQLDEKLKAVVVPEGHLRLEKVEDTIKGIKKFQWILIGAASTALTAMLLKVILTPGLAAAMGF